FGINVDSQYTVGATADGFKATSTTAGKCVQYTQTAQLTECVKKCAAYFVTHRMGAVRFGAIKVTTTELAGNHSHACASSAAAYHIMVTVFTIVGTSSRRTVLAKRGV